MKRLAVFLSGACALGFSLVVLTPLAPAKTLTPVPAALAPSSALASLIERRAIEVDSWERQATLLLSLTILVGVLGVATGLLQKFDHPRCKVATVAVGAAVSIVTIVTNGAFSGDYRTLRRNAAEARSLLDEATFMLSRVDPSVTAENRDAVLKEVFAKLKQIGDIPNRPTGTASLSLVSPAYAGGGPAPTWTSEPRPDGRRLSFVGTADSPSLEEAKATSYGNAVDQASDHLAAIARRERTAVTHDAIRRYVQRSATVDRTSFTFDPKQQTYRYYTLLTLDRSLARPELIVLFDQQRTPKEPTRGRTSESRRREQ